MIDLRSPHDIRQPCFGEAIPGLKGRNSLSPAATPWVPVTTIASELKVRDTAMRKGPRSAKSRGPIMSLPFRALIVWGHPSTPARWAGLRNRGPLGLYRAAHRSPTRSPGPRQRIRSTRRRDVRDTPCVADVLVCMLGLCHDAGRQSGGKPPHSRKARSFAAASCKCPGHERLFAPEKRRSPNPCRSLSGVREPCSRARAMTPSSPRGVPHGVAVGAVLRAATLVVIEVFADGVEEEPVAFSFIPQGLAVEDIDRDGVFVLGN